MIIQKSSFKADGLFKHSHFSTIHPFLKKVGGIENSKMEIFQLEDGDELDVEIVARGNKKLLILTHGLEGSSSSNYIVYTANAFQEKGFDICAINFRSCSGRMNKKPRLYHSGDTADLSFLVAKMSERYSEIVFCGFSMGGNIILKYLGETSSSLNSAIKRACVFSAPVDLANCSKELSSGFNRIYTLHFLKTLRQKVNYLRANHPELSLVTKTDFKNFLEFDEMITAPMFNFRGAKEYYQKASSRPWLDFINIPVLLVNAQNDPFLGKDCYPFYQAKEHKHLTLEVPAYGGHVGFFQNFATKTPWFVGRALEFLTV